MTNQDQSTDLGKDLEVLKILKELSDIVPSWQFVDLTRKGYNDQYIETLKKLLDYLQELLLKEVKLVIGEDEPILVGELPANELKIILQLQGIQTAPPIKQPHPLNSPSNKDRDDKVPKSI